MPFVERDIGKNHSVTQWVEGSDQKAVKRGCFFRHPSENFSVCHSEYGIHTMDIIHWITVRGKNRSGTCRERETLYGF